MRAQACPRTKKALPTSLKSLTTINWPALKANPEKSPSKP